MNKAEQFASALSEHWNKNNGPDDFENQFEPKQDNMMAYKTGTAIKYELEVMIQDQELELLIRFCKKHQVGFSLLPPLTFSFYVDNFKL